MAAIESTLVMGVVLLGIVAVIGFIRDWERTPDTGADQATTLVALFRRPVTWAVLFVAGVTLSAVAATAYVGGENVLGIGPGLGELALIAIGLSLLVGFLYGGLYSVYRSRGLGQAQAAGVSSVLLGLLFILVVAVHLVMG